MRIPLALLCAAALAGCGVTDLQWDGPAPVAASPVAVVASPLEPAAQLNGGHANYADGAFLGAAGGAGVGAMSAYSSAGMLCTIGGPLCMVVVLPVAVVGGLVGGVAGAAVDDVATDTLGRDATARATIEQAIADMRVTDGLAAKTSEQMKLPLAKAGVAKAVDAPGEFVLEVGVSELELLAHKTEMALVLRGRSRLVRSSDGRVLEEHEAESRTEFRKYQDWAADGGQPLRDAVDYALVRLGRSLVSARRESRPRADTSTPLDG